MTWSVKNPEKMQKGMEKYNSLLYEKWLIEEQKIKNKRLKSIA